MLSKEECVQAINNWEIAKSNYLTVSELFNPAAAFNFNQQDCAWINNHNNNSKFHTYIGVNNDELILIVVPLNENGEEIDLDAYLTSILNAQEHDLTLVERDVITTTQKTILSKKLELSKLYEEVELPTYNKPTLKENASLLDIEKWKNECLDWFYCECNDFGGQRIFRTFTVPFADLVKDDNNYNEVVVLFGFKNSTIYNRQIPILIFVAVNSETHHAKIIRSSALTTNTKDYSRPCPPGCRKSNSYRIFHNE